MKETLNIEQSQQTVQRLSPRQVQFVRLLEMNGPEIEDEVRRQLDDNPALEVVESADMQTENSDETYEVSNEPYDDSINTDPDDDPADYMKAGHASTSTDFAPQIADDSEDLYNYLTLQLGQIELPRLTHYIAQYIIGNIDENGYLTRSLSEMSDDISISTGVDITYQQITEAYNVVKSLDPPGVGAVDLRDCLLTQLRRLKPQTEDIKIAIDIIEHNFDLLSKKHYDRLRAQLDVSSTEMRRAINLIKSLNPKPGSGIAPSQTMLRQSHITPDVMLDFRDDNKATVSLTTTLPQLQVERSFVTDPEEAPNLSGAAAQAAKQAQAFVKLKREEAESFIGALKQRSSTLLTVTEAIARLQSEFFLTGDTSKLRPMILKDIANITGLDLSVISRAVSGKYVATDIGVFPLKMFFNEPSNDDTEISTHKILHDLKNIIDREDKRHPLSDEALKEELDKIGYKLARRTVTKYREKLGLPIGRLRKGM